MLKNIAEIQTRRYNLKEIAIEIFMRECKIYFINLFSHRNQTNFIKVLQKFEYSIDYAVDRRQGTY
jgi:hypothetical protein